MNNYGLNFGPELNSKLRSAYSKNEKLIKKLADKCEKDGFSCLRFRSYVIKLAVCIEYLKFTKAQYDKLQIDDKIFNDTIKDIEIWCSNNADKGLKNYNWIKNHLKCELFKIGRLQYQIYPCKNATLQYDKLPFKYGDNLIYVHIPQGEKLDYDACLSSLKQAKTFFEKHYPNYEFTYFFSESWLLYSKNCDFMKNDSNIIKFQSLSDHNYDFSYDGQTIERVFGKRQISATKYPENTSLQKSLKQYIINGNKPGLGIATINKNRL